MNDITTDIIKTKKEEIIDKKVEELVKANPNLVIDNSILELEYNVDGSKKDIYSLSSEKDIKEMQIQSDINEIEYNFKEKKITKQEYEKQKEIKKSELLDLRLLYNDLIFNIINSNSIENIKMSITKYNLNEIDLKRLKEAINSVIEYKIDEFTENNKKFMIDKLTYWNYKYNELSKSISKSREVEDFINNLI